MGDSSEEERVQRIERNEQLLEDTDEGFDSASNTSDFAEIIVDRRYPLPSRPPLHEVNSSEEEEERQAARGGRRPYDRYPRWVKNVSRGDDDANDPAAAIRNMLRRTRTDGHGISDNILEAKRITGSATKGGRVCYFVQWSNNGKNNHPLDEHLMRWSYPELVINFHEGFYLKSTQFVKW